MKAVALALLAAFSAHAETVPPVGDVDSRIRVLAYNPSDVVSITGFIGYSLHVRFAEGEKVVTLNSGALASLDIDSEGSSLFVKPLLVKAPPTNITVLTDRRVYNFDYTVAEAKAGKPRGMIYSLQFVYPQDEIRAAAAKAEQAVLEDRLRKPAERPRNTDYWFCGSPSLKPESASDDGLQTRLLFPASAEFPAVFAQSEDGTESLVNFNIDEKTGEVVVHRLVRRLVLRRGSLAGCVVNKAFDGSGVLLPSGSMADGVERTTRRPQ